MKKLYTFFALLALTATAIAQPEFNNAGRLHFHQSFVNSLMSRKNNAAALRSTATERIIAQSTYDEFGSKVDSVKLNYGLNGTSVYDFNMMLYGYNYPYNSTPMFNYLGVFAKPQVLSDSYSHWTIDPNTLTYGFFEKDLSRYDFNHNLVMDTALFADSSLIPNMSYVNKFNAAGNIDTGYAYVYKLGVSSNAFKQFFSYNASNLITKDSIYAFHAGTWHFASKTSYVYDVSNNLVQIDNYSNTTDTTYTSPLIHQLQYLNTYDGTGRLLTVQASYDDGTAFTPYVRDTFAYTGSSVFHTSWKEYQYDAINGYWAPMTYMTKTLNGAGYPTIIDTKTFDSLANAWVPSIKQLVKYDSYNNPDTLSEYQYNFTSFPSTPAFTTYYYYESFVNTTAINDMSHGHVIVFPNPSRGLITISGVENSGAAKVSVYNINGELVMGEEMQSQNGTFSISIGGLPSGIYVIAISNDKGNILHRQRVIKME